MRYKLNVRDRKIIGISVTVILLLAGLVYAGLKNNIFADVVGSEDCASSPIIASGQNPNLKIVETDDYSTKGTRCGYSLVMARNEYEPFVISVNNPTSTAIQNLELKSPTDMPNYEFEFYELATAIYVGKPQSDVLKPLAGTLSIDPGAQKFFWVNVYAKTNAPAGNKMANIRIVGVGDFKIKINQTAIPIPAKSTFNNVLGFRPRLAFNHSGFGSTYTSPDLTSKKQALMENYLSDFSKHRLSPTLYSGSNLSNLLPEGQVTWDYSAETDTFGSTQNVNFNNLKNKIDLIKNLSSKPFNIAPYFFMDIDSDSQVEGVFYQIDNIGTIISGTSIVCEDFSNCPRYDNAVKDYFSEWSKFLEDNGLLDNAFYYLADEPETNACVESVVGSAKSYSCANLEAPKHLASLIKEAAPNLKIALTYHSARNASALIYYFKDYVNIWNSDVYAVMWTIQGQNSYEDMVKGYVRLDTTESTDADQDALWRTKQFWVYDGDVAYRVDSNPEKARLMPWIAYKAGAKGNLYYASNIWDSALEKIYPYGTPALYYRPTSFVSVPTMSIIRSVRLEMAREGAEDIELFRLLEAKDPNNSKLATAKGKLNIASWNNSGVGDLRYLETDKLMNSIKVDLSSYFAEPSPTPVPSPSQTATIVSSPTSSPSPSPSPTVIPVESATLVPYHPPAELSYTFPKGFSTLGVTKSLSSAIVTTVDGLYVYQFDGANNKWLVAPRDSFTLEPGQSYYVYNINDPKAISLPFDSTVINSYTLTSGWNLLHTTSDKSLTQLIFIYNNATQSAQAMIANNQIYQNIFIISDTTSTQACSYFKLLGATDTQANCSNNQIGTSSKVPASKAFWVYVR